QALRFEHNIDYIYNIGVVYNYKGLYSDALSYFEKCLTIEDEHYNSIANIAVIYLKKNMPSEAKFYFRKALNIKPDDEQNIYMLAALEGNQEKFKAAPPSYITDLFDQYANTFEQHLEKILQYKAPKIIYETLVKFNDIENCKNLDICDVGCGTGLMAEELKQHSKKLIGVDLSSKMLEKASVKKLYTDLVESDISVYLSQHKLEFDYIIAADVVPYFGDISVLLQSVFGALKNEGYFVFSIEQCFKTNYQLQTNGRFKHSREYIKSLSNENMFNLKACTERSTRKEGNNEIPCLIFVLQKQIASSIT
ncbi:MAG: methyltransferase domain-containing protein, partial [Pseudomonadota bacterium]|nr:methyltransferase domain-containing protein [Pseudomonadota bacterium]